MSHRLTNARKCVILTILLSWLILISVSKLELSQFSSQPVPVQLQSQNKPSLPPPEPSLSEPWPSPLKLQTLNNQTVPRQSNLSEPWPSPSKLVHQFDEGGGKKRCLVIAGVTCGYVEFADNFVQSLERNGVYNYLLVPLDEGSLKILRKAYPSHVLDRVPGLAGTPAEATFSEKKDFKNVTSSRPQFILAFLLKGYTVLYNDIDRVWLQNVFLEFDRIQEKHKNVTLIVVDDVAHGVSNKKESPYYSTSLLYMEPTQQNIDLMRNWSYAIMADNADRSGGDQGYFNDVFHKQKESNNILNDQWHKAYTGDFPTGIDYFLDFNNYSSHGPYNTQVVHANYLVGKKKKRQYLMDKGHWNLSGKIPVNFTCHS